MTCGRWWCLGHMLHSFSIFRLTSPYHRNLQRLPRMMTALITHSLQEVQSTFRTLSDWSWFTASTNIRPVSRPCGVVNASCAMVTACCLTDALHSSSSFSLISIALMTPIGYILSLRFYLYLLLSCLQLVEQKNINYKAYNHILTCP